MSLALNNWAQFGHITFLETAREILSMVILLLSQIQERQLSVSGESVCTNSSSPLRRLNLTRKSVSRLTDGLNMTISLDWAVKLQLPN